VRHCTDNVVPRALSIQNFACREKYEGNSFPKMELDVQGQGWPGTGLIIEMTSNASLQSVHRDVPSVADAGLEFGLGCIGRFISVKSANRWQSHLIA
jgi:hypothetical protein